MIGLIILALMLMGLVVVPIFLGFTGFLYYVLILNGVGVALCVIACIAQAARCIVTPDAPTEVQDVTTVETVDEIIEYVGPARMTTLREGRGNTIALGLISSLVFILVSYFLLKHWECTEPGLAAGVLLFLVIVPSFVCSWIQKGRARR